ncbi:hypothetical protein Plec18167_008910 [Paecilomyces lecythidis]|uniref:Uncharacterized protein n=1 Tax=Paecilomyces lecythidis TaxID=3004212 RepID=A0ABR3WSX3_9EURO
MSDLTDLPELPHRRPTRPADPPHLRYPTFPPLSLSVEEWLSQSRPANMTSNLPVERPESSLSESWATLSVSDIHSEDGTRSEQTDIGSLIDQNGPDDVTSLDGQETNSEIDGNDDEQSNISESQELPPLFARVNDGIHDSNITTKAAFQPTDSIEFREPEQWPGVERVELKHTVRVLGGLEASELKEHLSPQPEHSSLMVTVQQTMTKQGLDLDKPFRVLYVGNPDFRHIILDKIGDILVSSSNSDFECSSTESSRYHVVPTSFGAGATPNYAELLPIHVQLVVDECVDAALTPQVDSPSSIDLQFKNRAPCTSSWAGTEYQISSPNEWTLPDLAIFLVSGKDDDHAVMTRQLAHTFVKRHGVATMAISDEPFWKKPAEIIPLDYHSLHMCLESRHSLTGESVVLRRYPIDLKTFESITPGQLNRNLASLCGLYSTKASNDTDPSRVSHSYTRFFDSEKNPKHMISSSSAGRVHELIPLFRIVTLAIVSAIAISLGLSAFRATSVFFLQQFARSSAPSIYSTSSVVVSTTWPPLSEKSGETSLAVMTSLSAPIEAHVSSYRYDDTSTAEDIMGAALAVTDQSARPDKFQVQAIGDRHVIIKPPQSFTSARRQPKFNLNVTKGGRSLPYELSKLFEGVYTLKLDREDAYGLINVTTTASRPHIEQVTEIDFGTPWLKIANWKKAAHAVSSQLAKDLSTAQTGLSEVYDRLSTDLQLWIGDATKKSHVLRREAEMFGRGSVQRSKETTDAVLSRSKELSELVRRNTVQGLSTASSALQGRTRTINKEVKELANDAWKRMSLSTRPLHLNGLTERLQDLRHCKPLAKAHMGARSLLKKESHEHLKSGKPIRKERQSHHRR